ncbi:MAG: ankyrin repeat domain-containing protein [Alphaproteobacteria bacterium]|nr:ankyrin repeat domain-containing protein [Alphaproteobacteria bacterium]
MNNTKSWNNTWGKIDWKNENPQDIAEKVDKLIASGANVNEANEYGFTALLYATSENRFEAVKKLIAAGADIEQASDEWTTPLINASKAGATQCVEILLSHNADINKQNKFGETALIGAAFWGQTECVEKLIMAGAKLNISDDNGNTPLSNAMERHHIDCIDLLLTARKMQEHPEIVATSSKYRAEKREYIRRHKASIQRLYADLTKTTPERHALAVKLNEIRKEFGCKAKHISATSRIIQELRKKAHTR